MNAAGGVETGFRFWELQTGNWKLAAKPRAAVDFAVEQFIIRRS